MNVWAKPVVAAVGSLTMGTLRASTVALDKPTLSSRTVHLRPAGPVVGRLRDIEATVSADGETISANGRITILSVGDTPAAVELTSTLERETLHVWALPLDTVGGLDSLSRSWISEGLAVCCQRNWSWRASAISAEKSR